MTARWAAVLALGTLALPWGALAAPTAHDISVTVDPSTPASLNVFELGLDGYTAEGDYSHLGYSLFSDAEGHSYLSSGPSGYITPLNGIAVTNDGGALTYTPPASTTPGTIDRFWYQIADYSRIDEDIIDYGNVAEFAIMVGEPEATSTPDTTPPEITILGDNPLTLTQGAVFMDPGFTATDDTGVVATSTEGSIDTSVVGTTILTYHASDAAANEATSTREVIVEAPASSGSDEEEVSSSKGSTRVHHATNVHSGMAPSKVLGAGTYAFITPMDYGETSADVYALQTLLASQGYLAGVPTGFYGFLTKDAVYRYQVAHSIATPNGRVGPQTLELLNHESFPVNDTANMSAALAQLAARVAALAGTAP